MSDGLNDEGRPGGRSGGIAAVGILSAAVSAVFVLASVADARDERAVGSAYVQGFEDATGIDLVLASGDGQAYAALARDPTLSHPQAFPTVDEAAYRASRPLLGYAAWAGSLGRPAWVPGALVALTILGGGLAGAAAAALLANRGVLPWLGVAVVLLPGSLATLSWLLAEVLAFAFAAAGLALWERGRAPWVAVALLAAAGLTREVLLLVPLVLFVLTFRSGGARAAFPFVVPFVVWLTWAAIIRIRVGFWPFEWHAETRAEMPFSGIVRGISRWEELGTNVAANSLALAMLLAFVVALIVMRSADPARWVALSFLIIPPFFWAEMWHRWQDFTRVLLPLTAFGAIAIASVLLGSADRKELARGG